MMKQHFVDIGHQTVQSSDYLERENKRDETYS